MANNLLISYDLHRPGQNYERLAEAIKELGTWAKVHQSFWFVSSDLTAAQVRDRLLTVVDQNDLVFVVDAKNNVAAWNGLARDVSDHIRDYWA